MTTNGEPLRVLIIDDEEFHAETLAESLQRVGYECVVASTGARGAKRIGQEDWDVILTDLKMPDLDGLAILRKAKQELPEAEVVVITGHGDVKTAVEAMKAGAAHFLEKPVNLQELRATVDKAAQRRQQGAPPPAR
jgi:two-component system response regulator HydG